MAELEKVIRGLECLSNPYVQDMDERDCENCKYDNASCFLDVTADALSLLKAQEPRVMAIEELEKTVEPVFIELKTKGDDEALTCFGLLSEWDNLSFHFIIDQWLLDGKPFFRMYGCELKRKEYNIQWRPWNKRPTVKQMKAVKWDE